eukprot:TRINITY_DN3058_c0_g1_i1.p1 TRINITY_DN3058_c0_g1~~TRINITY_DN3058_c0_g1_i1.p1  ORF type:complete len:403 (+),score=39.09 TRINITY_DN3058_c0_g1_i1:54-1262(+)
MVNSTDILFNYNITDVFVDPYAPGNGTGFDSMSIADWNLLAHLVGSIFGWISVCCSLYVVYLWLRSPKTRNQYSMRLVGILAICDIIMELGIASDHTYSLTTELNWADNDHPLCTYFGIVFYFGFVCTWLWTTCISVNLAFLIFQPMRSKPRRLPIIWLAAATFGTALSCVVVVASLGGFGVVHTAGTQWCLIKNSQPVLYIIFGFIPALVIWLTMTGIYAYIIFKLYFTFYKNEHLPKDRKQSYMTVIQKSIVYPLIFLCIWLPAFIWTIWFYVGGLTRPITFFTILSANMSGIFNTTGYVVVSRLIALFKPKDKLSSSKSDSNMSNTNFSLTKSQSTSTIHGHTQEEASSRRSGVFEPPEVPSQESGSNSEDNEDVEQKTSSAAPTSEEKSTGSENGIES